MEEQITSAAGHRGTHELWVFWHRSSNVQPAKLRPDAERHGFATQWHGVFKDGEISNVFIILYHLPHFLLVFYGISQARWPRYSLKWRKRTNPVMPTLLQSDMKHQPKRKSLKNIPKKIEKSRQVRCKNFILLWKKWGWILICRPSLYVVLGCMHDTRLNKKCILRLRQVSKQ